MKFIQPVVMLLGVAAYIIVFDSVLGGEDAGTYKWLPYVVIGVWNVLVLVAVVLTIVDSIRKIRAGNSMQLAADAMVTKLASIPFFVISVIVLTSFFLVSFLLLLFGGPVLWVVIPIVGFLIYIVMLTTSIYGWAAIAQMRRQRIIGTALSIVYAVLLFLPIADTVVGVLLFGRRRPRLALVVALLVGGLVLIAIGILGFGTFTPADGEDPLNPVRVASTIVFIVGVGGIVATTIVSVIRRSILRTEAQQATVAVGASSESYAPDRVLAR